MQLHSLRVAHLLKKKVKKKVSSPSCFLAFDGAFYLNTCQRWLWIATAHQLDQLPHFQGLEIYEGVEAYRFLLLIAAGLESEIQGETDIFGQMKEAWHRYESLDPPLLKELNSWMQKIFEDTKEIRNRYLQNLGGASSYGSLVRKILKKKLTRGPVLIVGAGQIARSVVPWLTEFELWLWNRNLGHLTRFQEYLLSKPHKKIQIVEGPDAESMAWREATDAVVCIPPDPQGDERRVQLWKQGNHCQTKDRFIVHLGVSRDQLGEWSQITDFYSLDDLFDLQRAQGNTRSSQIVCAIKACHEKALLRNLGGSLTLPHGWEDLAAFA